MTQHGTAGTAWNALVLPLVGGGFANTNVTRQPVLGRWKNERRFDHPGRFGPIDAGSGACNERFQCAVVDELDDAQYADAHKQSQNAAAIGKKVTDAKQFAPLDRDKARHFEVY